MPPHDPLLELALEVSDEAGALGVDCVLIGALALAHYGYIRSTVDVDFATYTSFDHKLRPLADRLRAKGHHVDLLAPDDDDPLGGVLRVRRSVDDDPVDIVNFRGPSPLGRLVVERGERAEDRFRYVRLPELVALKLYAGSRFDRDDAAHVLAGVSDAALAEVREVCDEVGLGEELASLLAELASP